MNNRYDDDQENQSQYYFAKKKDDQSLSDLEPISVSNVKKGHYPKQRVHFDFSGLVKPLIKIALIVIVILVGYKVYCKYFQKTYIELAQYKDKDTATIEKELSITLGENTNEVQYIPSFEFVPKVFGDKEIYVIMNNNLRIGLRLEDSKEYTLKGVKIGEKLADARKILEDDYTDTVEFFNDNKTGSSTTTMYYNREENEGVAITVNDTSDKIVAITYYWDVNIVINGMN